MDQFRKMFDTQRLIDPATIEPTFPPLPAINVPTGTVGAIQIKMYCILLFQMDKILSIQMLIAYPNIG
ncbi:exosporium leader peptide-containing protein [Bacillus cereus]|uniref:exosporium leader peptide-containing protein n=1 Tax=Bacillus cereus TaxID=1396 RepID=UPI0015CF1446